MTKVGGELVTRRQRFGSYEKKYAHDLEAAKIKLGKTSDDKEAAYLSEWIAQKEAEKIAVETIKLAREANKISLGANRLSNYALWVSCAATVIALVSCVLRK